MLLEQVPELSADLYRLAAKTEVSEFQEAAFREINIVMPIDSGMWGHFAQVDDTFETHHMKMFQRPPDMIFDLINCEYPDPAREENIRTPGKTASVRIQDLPPEGEPRRKILNKYDIACSLSTCIVLPVSHLLHVVGVQRGQKSKPFSENERQFQEALVPHLIESLRQNRHLQIRRELLRKWEKNHCAATANQQGVLSEIEDRFVDLLVAEWPNWQGARLPAPLVENISKESNWRYQGEHIVIHADSRNEECLMIAGRPGPFNSLSPREQEIAHLFAHGKTHKQIAEQLCISPATARNHVASVYGKLDVSNKTDLLDKLSQ